MSTSVIYPVWTIVGSPVLFSPGAVISVPQTQWLKQQQFVVSRFCRPEGRDQGAGGTGFFLRAARKNLPLDLSLARR